MEADGGQSLEGTVPVVEVVESCELAQKINDPQLVGVPVEIHVGGDETPAQATMNMKVGFKLGDSGGEKRKRGRPPRGQGKPPPPKRIKEEEEEEDVCFICFDGGSLVLCDRKGCPKAYHPACIKRDEAFFRSKARWNCGWHICSSCQKAAHYMCYTCTYSLCKGCTNQADYVCARGNKGFCATCMRTIMMIENKEHGNKEMDQVDFDDKSSWEYLFKVYWIYLKKKLSLTFDELTQAKNPWKEINAVAYKEPSPNAYNAANKCKTFSLVGSSEDVELNNSKRKNTNKQSKLQNMDSLSMEKPNPDESQFLNNLANGEKEVAQKISCSNGGNEWASLPLLEFVAHMKNGDTSSLSQFDVQELLLDYIKRNNLRDPHRKSQIVCDSMLTNLFGKARVGHFEMLKLLEFHFLMKDDCQNNVVPAAFVNTTNQVEADWGSSNLFTMAKEKRRKTRRKGEDRVEKINLGEYAAIDVHNINLIYLRRILMERLIEDNHFLDKVVGSVVRIRISSSNQKQEIYRLVQVVGTCKVDAPYKIGNRTADIMLEIHNLDKKEAISIDAISNQEFSKDECRRLRQSIKCGLVKRLTVGEIQKKAMAFQAVRLSSWLETEIYRLNHLRDRASEKGRKKELREYVEKLERLKSPEERQRKLNEIPEVHVDPKMDPSYESADDVNDIDNQKQDVKNRPTFSAFQRKGSEQISERKADKNEGSIWSMKRVNGGNCALQSNLVKKSQSRVNSTNSTLGGGNNQAAVTSLSSCSMLESETSTIPLFAESLNSETNKMWHYRDPHGKIQGPFGMFQLRKWNTTGFFPSDMRIWISDEPVDSVLLTDALHGKFPAALLSTCNFASQATVVFHASVGGLHGNNHDQFKTVNATTKNSEKDDARHSYDERLHHKGEDDIKSGGLCLASSDWTTSTTSYKRQTASCSLNEESLKSSNSRSDQSKLHSPLPSSTLSEQSNLILAQPERDHDSERWNMNSKHEKCDPKLSSVYQATMECNKECQSNSLGHSRQPSGQNLKPLPAKSFLSNSETCSDFSTLSIDASRQKDDMDIVDLPSPTPKTFNDRDVVVPSTMKSMSKGASIQDSDVFDLPSPTPMSNVEAQKGEVYEKNQPMLSNIPVQDSGPSWGSASSLVTGGAQLPEKVDEWGGSSPNIEKTSVEEWDSCLVSSLNPSEGMSDYVATPTSNLYTWSEPIEFSTLAEESVSDLLAEVDAMESQRCIASPTSEMNCDSAMIQDYKRECFSSIEELSPPDTGKSDALSSTGDLHLPCQPAVTDDPVGAFPADTFDHAKSRGEQTTSAEMEKETKLADIPVNHTHTCLDTEPSVSFTTSELVSTNVAHSVGFEATCQDSQENVSLSWGMPAQEITNMGCGITTRVSISMNGSSLTGIPSWESQRKHGGERYNGLRERALPGGDSGFCRSRQPWSRPSHGVGVGQGGVPSRPPSKGRVCKFYGNGGCRKGAMCDYLHP